LRAPSRHAAHIDLHRHIVPHFFWQAINEQHRPVDGIAPAHRSAESALSFLDEARIDIVVRSISTPRMHLRDDGAARVLTRRCDEFSAGLMRKHRAPACPLPEWRGLLDAGRALRALPAPLVADLH
jgi:hypothetical protein